MNTGNSKINDSSKFIYQFTDKFNSNSPNNKNFGLVNLSFYYAWKNIKSAYNNNQFKMPAPIWNDAFDLPDGSYPSNLQCHHSYDGIEDYFEFIIKKHDVFKVKAGYKLELLSPETMKLLGEAEKDVDKDKNGEGGPKLESVEVFLVQCNLVNDSYQQASKVLFIFVPNKQLGH